MTNIKGMIQIKGTTYRIVRLQKEQYQIIRIIDDIAIGSFETKPKLMARGDGVDISIVIEIALSAIRNGRLTWQNAITP